MAHTHVHISPYGLCLSQSKQKQQTLHNFSTQIPMQMRPTKKYYMGTMCCETNKGNTLTQYIHVNAHTLEQQERQIDRLIVRLSALRTNTLK